MAILVVISRAVWRARGALAARTGQHRRVIVHTEAGAAMSPTATPAQEQARMRAVDAYHLTLGWSGGFGYSEAWFPSGRVYEGRGVRRSGAHTQGLNHEFGVMLPGHGDRSAMTEPQIAAGRTRIRDLIVAGDLAPGYLVSGHRDHIPPGTKSCPGRHPYAQLHRLRGVTTTSPAPPAPPVPKEDIMATLDQLRDVVSTALKPIVKTVAQLGDRLDGHGRSLDLLRTRANENVRLAEVGAQFAVEQTRKEIRERYAADGRDVLQPDPASDAVHVRYFRHGRAGEKYTLADARERLEAAAARGEQSFPPTDPAHGYEAADAAEAEVG